MPEIPQTATPVTSHRKIGLDYVRAIAILCVLICHTYAAHNPRLIGFPLLLGVIGVELFFVLSGYLIGGIFLVAIDSAGGRVSLSLLWNFWVRRWMRTLPNYLLFLGVWYWLAPPPFLRQMLLYATFTQNLVRPLPSDFFIPSWSLTVEEWFYFLMPLIALVSYVITRRSRIAMWFTVAVLFVVPFALRVVMEADYLWARGVRMIAVCRLDAIMWGVALAMIQRYRRPLFHKLQRRFVMFVGLELLALASVWLLVRLGGQEDFAATPADAIIFTAISASCALCIPFCASQWRDRRLLNTAAYHTSLWSYSIYLSHIPVFILLSRFYSRYGIAPGHAVQVITAWIAVFAVSAGAYYAWERPILRLRDRMTRRKSPAPPLPTATTLGVT